MSPDDPKPTDAQQSPAARTGIRKLLHPLAAPFTDIVGGPQFHNCEHRRISCGSNELEFFHPRPRFGSGARPDFVDPDDDHAFNGVAYDARSEHTTAKLGGSNWNYHRPRLHPSRFLPFAQGPYVVITAIWQLERVKHDLRLDRDDLASLEQYLRDDYEDYMESEGGVNWNVRKQSREAFKPEDRDQPWAQETINEFIESGICHAPRHYEPMIFNGSPWLRYVYQPGLLVDALNYSHILTPRTLLTLYLGVAPFLCAEDAAEQWESALLRDGDKLMSGMRLHVKTLAGSR